MRLKHSAILLLLTSGLTASGFIQDDKVKHIAVGTFIYLACLPIVYVNNFDSKYCLLPVLTAAIGKEVYDSSNAGTAEFSDITATMFVPMTTYVIYKW